MNATNRHPDAERLHAALDADSSPAPHRDWLDDLVDDHPVAGAPTLDRKHYLREADYDDFQRMAEESDDNGMRAAAIIVMAALLGWAGLVLMLLWWWLS